MKNYKEAFDLALDQLNVAQREATKTIEGPVLVIAGPGTGKTQILAARIGYILSSTDSNPENILCLTYTDAGAIAMRKRLLELIGPDAYRVNVSTFHAFCNEVIQDNLDIFGFRSMEPISDLEAVELLRSLVDTFGKDHPLKRWTGDVYFETKRLRNLFHVMKSEGWTPEFISEKVDEYLASLPDNPDFIYKRSSKYGKKGEVNQRLIDKEVTKMTKLKAAAGEYPRYRMMMEQSSRYDYDDMILWVLQQFKSNSDLLLNYQEQYHYFLVDEYQDTNGVQNEILQQLTSYWEVPNVFVVGDDDQSIYRFQGANVANIMEFYNRHKSNLKLIMMLENYRSSQRLLNAANGLISFNKERLIRDLKHLNLSKELIASNTAVADSTAKPRIQRYYNLMHEEADIASQIEALYHARQSLDEVAVLYLKHAQAADLSTYLERKGIPVNIKRNANVLESILIRQILLILKYISGEKNQPYSRDDLLFKMLHFSFTDIEPLAVAKIAFEIRNLKGGNRKHYRDAISSLSKNAQGSLFADGGASLTRIGRFSDNIEYWIKEADNVTLQNLVEKIISRSGVLSAVMNDPDKTWKMQELSTFFEFLKTESAKNPSIDIDSFLERIDLMEADSISLPIHKTAYAEKGVNFITTHSAKGLEFKYVFLMGCTSDIWDKNYSNRYNYAFPDNVIQKKEGDDTEERRRLFYVAMTRAKEYLQISFPNADNQLKDLEMSRYVAEVASSSELPIEDGKVEDEVLIDYKLTMLQEQKPVRIELLDRPHLKKLLENYSMSVTHLNKYLKCPLTFYFEALLKVPQAKNAAMEFGSAVHYALEKFFEKMRSDGNVFPDEQELVRFFEIHMNTHKDSFTSKQFERRMQYGRQILPQYYLHHKDKWNRVVTVERRVNGVEVLGIPINGMLDKIEFDGKQANVVDYKTGKFENSKRYNNFNRPGEKVSKDAAHHVAQYGGDYWRQAVFYKILLDNDHRQDWKVVSGEFDYIEPDTTGLFHKKRIDILEKDVTQVKAQIQFVHQKIMDLQFDNGCGMENCRWCAFVNQNFKELAEAPAEVES